MLPLNRIMASGLLLTICGCATQPANTPSQAPTSVQSAGECKLDTAKICAEAQSAGTLETMPRSGGYGTSQGTMPDTARLAVPNGPTVQVMCYYDPQHKSLAHSDWTSSSAVDAGAVGFLKSKGYCAGP